MASAQVMGVAGPLIVGYLLNWGLFGVLSVQVYIYSLAFPKDRVYNKLLVLGIYILEVTQSVLMAHDLFRTFASGFGSVEILMSTRLIGIFLPIINSIVAFFVQTFYGYRIKLLSGSNVLPILIFVMSLIQLVGGFICGIRSQTAGQVTNLVTLPDRLGHGLFDVTTAVCDITIAVYLAYYLSGTKPAFRCTQSLISRIVFLSIGTGFVTATVAVIDLALYYAFPGTAIFIPPLSVLGKSYSNSMMVMLNSRATIHVERKIPEGVAVVLEDMHLKRRDRSLSLPNCHLSNKEDTSIEGRIDILVKSGASSCGVNTCESTSATT